MLSLPGFSLRQFKKEVIAEIQQLTTGLSQQELERLLGT